MLKLLSGALICEGMVTDYFPWSKLTQHMPLRLAMIV